jgi:alpha-glucosidase
MNYSGFTRPVWAWLNTPGHGLTWLGLPGEIPSLPGSAVAATMRDFAASTPWAAWTRSMTILDSHDTPRFRTVVGGRDRHLVGAALLATMPGAPMIFAGDEIGLTGVDGEDSRTPFPWRHRDRWDTVTLDAYRALLRLRRDHVALRRGGLRWVHAGADSLTFLREHPDERLLVHVARAEHDAVRLPLGALGARRVSALYGDACVGEDLGTVELPARGPAAHVYHLD